MTKKYQNLMPSLSVAPPTDLRIYNVHEHELDALAAGTSASLMLNFSLFFLGVSASALGTLWSAPPANDRLYYTFLIVFLVTLISGIVLLALWWTMHTSTRSLVARIKGKMPPNPEVREDPVGNPSVE